MEFLLELLLEIFGAILEEVFKHVTLPKWLRCTLLIILLLALPALLIFAFLRLGWIMLQALLCVAALALLIFGGCRICHRLRYGRFRQARKEELPQILKLYRSVIGRPGCNWSITYPNEATLQEDFRTGNLYVLRKGRKIIGAGSIVPSNEQDDLLCWYYRDNAREIARIVIAPAYQGKGLGKHLVRKLCRTLKKSGCQAVHILVSTKNSRAISFYREVGFFSRGQCHRYDHDYNAYEKKL